MYKELFPYFKNSKTVYLDNAATTQKPQTLIDEISKYYTHYCANTHRGSYDTANKATTLFEKTRKDLKEFINASKVEEIIFTKGVSEAINFIASSFAKSFKTVIISSLEHHSNITPWHMQDRSLHKGLEVVKYKDNLEFDYDDFELLLKNNKEAFVSITHISNAFGVIHDIKKITKLAHKYQAVVLIDAAQSLAHTKVDMQDLDVDFFAMSAHKTFGATGLGAIYIKTKFLDSVEPYQTGGATIEEVDFNSSTLLRSPYKFEAGTQNISAVVSFSKALELISFVTYEKIQKIEKDLYDCLYKELLSIPDIIMYNDNKNSTASRSFCIKDISNDDIGILLAKQNIAIRVGHHCAQPIMKALGIKGTIRVSLAFYNDKEDIKAFIKALILSIKMLKD